MVANKNRFSLHKTQKLNTKCLYLLCLHSLCSKFLTAVFAACLCSLQCLWVGLISQSTTVSQNSKGLHGCSWWNWFIMTFLVLDIGWITVIFLEMLSLKKLVGGHSHLIFLPVVKQLNRPPWHPDTCLRICTCGGNVVERWATRGIRAYQIWLVSSS